MKRLLVFLTILLLLPSASLYAAGDQPEYRRGRRRAKVAAAGPQTDMDACESALGGGSSGDGNARGAAFEEPNDRGADRSVWGDF